MFRVMRERSTEERECLMKRGSLGLRRERGEEDERELEDEVEFGLWLIKCYKII